MLFVAVKNQMKKSKENLVHLLPETSWECLLEAASAHLQDSWAVVMHATNLATGNENTKTNIHLRHSAFTPLASLLRLHILRDREASRRLFDLCKTAIDSGKETAMRSPDFEIQFARTVNYVLPYL